MRRKAATAERVLRHLHLVEELMATGSALKEVEDIFGARLRGD